MFISAYQTAPLREYQIGTLVKELDKHRVVFPNQIKAAELKRQLRYIAYLITPSLNNIPPFGHPLIIARVNNHPQEISTVDKLENLVDNQDVFCMVDVRNFTRLNRDESIQVTSNLDYNLAVVRASLSLYALRNSVMDLAGLGNFPVTIYSRWLTEQLTRRLALSPETQMRATVIIAFYYLSQFTLNDIDERERLRIATVISRSTFINTEFVLGIIESLPKLTDIYSLCNALKEHSQDIRFEKFNPALLYGIVAGSWFGFNNRELTAVALEHIPTFIAMLYFAVHERGYRNTVISKVAKEYTKGDNEKVFVRGVEQLVFAD